MMYSVWNYGNRSYDYYQSDEKGATHAATPPKARGALERATRVQSRDLGATPDQAAWPLPAGARKVGSGPRPQGKIASLGDASSGGIGLLEIVGGLAVVWFIFGRKKGR